jgi:hypothetical protein
VVLARIKRWLTGGDPPAPAAPRAPIAGSVRIGDREWQVREERRAGPWPQLLVLTAADAATSEMHVRLPEGDQIVELAELAPRAASPTCRWLADAEGARWETRLVLSDSPGRPLVKFIHWPDDVHEGDYPFEDGLGLRTDAELRDLLRKLRG